MAAKPTLNFSLCQTVSIVQFDQPPIGFGIGKNQFMTVHHEEHCCRDKGSPLVAINKGMVLREAFKECCGLFNHISIITGLGTAHGRFQARPVADRMHATMFPSGFGVNLDNFVEREKSAHCANRRSKSSCFRANDSRASRKLSFRSLGKPSLRNFANSSTAACCSLERLAIKLMRF